MPSAIKPPVKPEVKPVEEKREPIYVKEQPSGGLSVTFQISPEDTKRLKLKAYRLPVDKFLWENIINPAVQGALY